jgi:hypothetical protein
MKKILLISILTIFSISACAPAVTPTEQALIPTEDPSTELTPAQEAAVERLSSELGLPAEQVGILSTDEVEWPDGCLGVQREGLMCTQAIVPGFKVVLQANGETYEIRTNKSGSQVVVVQNAPATGLLETALVGQLAFNLGLQESEISVVSSSGTEFTDACLGVALFEQTCAQVVTPGKVVILKANDFEFEYHVSEDGTRVQPATVALTWTREGGIAGFCNSLTVFLSGEAYGANCRGTGDATVMMFPDLISSDEQRQFFKWAGELGQMDVEASDPEGVADRMVVTLEFFGVGDNPATPDEERAMIEFAQSLYAKLFP